MSSEAWILAVLMRLDMGQTVDNVVLFLVRFPKDSLGLMQLLNEDSATDWPTCDKKTTLNKSK